MHARPVQGKRGPEIAAVRGEAGSGQSLRLAYNILQAAGCRSFKTDYVACPSCGRAEVDVIKVRDRYLVVSAEDELPTEPGAHAHHGHTH